MKKRGYATITFERPPVIGAHAGIVGPKEGEGPLGKYFDQIYEDPMMGEKTWEQAESALQRKAVSAVLDKGGLCAGNVDYFFAGDLLGQSIASSFGLEGFCRPVFGLYGACATIGEALILSAICTASDMAQTAMAVTSSHFASAERQFRFPLEYGSQRPLSATWTVTGSGAFLVASGKAAGGNLPAASHARITAVTPGQIVDMGVRDSMNMGACMAPAACHTIETHFRETGTGPDDFDAIITGDLGYVGQDILIGLMQKKGFDLKQKHMDCGIEIFDRSTQDTHSGGSGCGCSAVVLSAFILPRLENGQWKRVLFVPTGALLSPVSFNEGKGVPGIAHGIKLEAPGA